MNYPTVVGQVSRRLGIWSCDLSEELFDPGVLECLSLKFLGMRYCK